MATPERVTRLRTNEMDYSGKVDQVLVLKVELNNKSFAEQDKLFDLINDFTNKINKRFPKAQITIGSNIVESTGICLQDREKYP